MPDLYGAMDLGGTKLRAVVANLTATFAARSFALRGRTRPERVIARMIDTLAEASAEAGS
jgi:predicted NBD/HSP70 family sugar kinase